VLARARESGLEWDGPHDHQVRFVHLGEEMQGDFTTVSLGVPQVRGLRLTAVQNRRLYDRARFAGSHLIGFRSLIGVRIRVERSDERQALQSALATVDQEATTQVSVHDRSELESLLGFDIPGSGARGASLLIAVQDLKVAERALLEQGLHPVRRQERLILRPGDCGGIALELLDERSRSATHARSATLTE
jgi:hypothetical protein